MSVHTVPIPTGIDYSIGQLQQFMYERLYPMWGESGLTSAKFQVYGRVYRNSVKDGFLPQWYVAGVDYMLDMFIDDRQDAIMWFGVNDPTAIDYTRAEYNVSMYFFGNLNKVKPNNPTQRMDEKIVVDILSLLAATPYGFIVKSVHRDVDHVLEKFSGYRKKSAVVDNNHQPNLCVRFDMKCAIDINDHNCDRPIPQPLYFNAMTGAIRVIFKDTPNPDALQTLVNGVQIPLEYPTGETVTIPHLIGRYVFPSVQYNSVNMDTLAYNPSTGTYDYSPYSFSEDDKLLIIYNENQ